MILIGFLLVKHNLACISSIYRSNIMICYEYGCYICMYLNKYICIGRYISRYVYKYEWFKRIEWTNV